MKKYTIKQLLIKKNSIKILLLFIVFFSLKTTIIAQDLSIGLRTVKLTTSSLNNVINHYNDARPWLKNRLNRHNFLTGLSGKVEFNILDSDQFFWIFSMSYLRNKSLAKGTTPNGDDFKRRVRSQIFELGLIGCSYYPIDGLDFKVGVGVNVFTATWYGVHSKVNTNEDGWVNYTTDPTNELLIDKIFTTNSFSSSLELNLKYNVNDEFWLTFCVHTQREYIRNDFDFFNLHKELNPNTHSQSLFDLRAITNQWGITLYFSKNNY